jgi:hypothetical protein
MKIPSWHHLATRARPIALAGGIGSYVLLLGLAGWHNRHLINPDAVAYLRIASYYASGQTDLMVSGYWGPLLSWIMAPLLGLVSHPLGAARIAMGISALVFLWGCLSVFRALDIHPAGRLLATGIVAAGTVGWSVRQITPDLLMSGLLCLGVSRMLSAHWLVSRQSQLAAGMLCGAAYLAKAVALPVAVLLGVAITWLRATGRPTDTRSVVRSLMITSLGLLLVAGPWILILSLTYGRPTFSTAGPISHAIVGPPDVERHHPSFETLHTPAPGRIASWEDPSSLPYQYWSPVESGEYAIHQLKLVARNLVAVLVYLSGLDRLGVGLLAAVCGVLTLGRRRETVRENLIGQRWRWGAVLVACSAVVYLPVYALAPRYYYFAYPFLIAAAFGMVTWLTRAGRGLIYIPRLIGLAVVTVSFLALALGDLRDAVRGLDNRYSVASYELAERLKAAGTPGPIAGGRRGHEGLYVAFFMGEPWLGEESDPTPATLRSSRAQLVVCRRSSPLVNALDPDPYFEDLDAALFGHTKDTAQFPLKAYRVLPSGAVAAAAGVYPDGL